MKVGDPVTYVDTVAVGPFPLDRTYRRVRKGLVRSEIEEILSYAVFLVTKNGSPFLGPDQEGVRWVYGHHTEKSETGKALLAAYALYRCAA